MSEQCETETVAVSYYLQVSLTGTSGVQEWGPFATRTSAESALSALAGRGDVTKVTLERRIEA